MNKRARQGGADNPRTNLLLFFRGAKKFFRPVAGRVSRAERVRGAGRARKAGGHNFTGRRPREGSAHNMLHGGSPYIMLCCNRMHHTTFYMRWR